AVFSSWNTQRAVTYRRLNNIPDDWGTAVNVQAMVFGNLGDTSATGVAFTRNPSTGAKELYGEFLPNAQGEDVVAGIRTPQLLTEAGKKVTGARKAS
ncbi:PEP/pyruvate-binding domain-containing protein, partial [Acinetobacter baumannii]